MIQAYVLMTAMPPTKGHRALIEFASNLADRLNVILCTQPDEPFVYERNAAVYEMVNSIPKKIQLHLVHKTLPQEPEGNEGFWGMWTDFLKMFGFQPGDLIVASEAYGKTLADYAGGVFMPFDIERSINPQKATVVRESLWDHFDWIAEEFQPVLRKTITIFGAESTGKTTLSKRLAQETGSHWLPEYARPYLENTVNEITERSMTAIWKGQLALQQYGQGLKNAPLVIQDTDLFSTVGYWEMAPWDICGKAPDSLIADALFYRSDLYLITLSNIPFEQDPLRYGGDQREINDRKWINFCQKYDLPYFIIPSSDLDRRLAFAITEAKRSFYVGTGSLSTYQREGAEYVQKAAVQRNAG